MSRKLKVKQIKALHLLAQGDSCIAISRRLKLRAETLSRWRKIPEFILEYEKLMNEMRLNMKDQITNLMNSSITVAKRELYAEKCDAKRLQIALNMIKTLEKEI
jgi:hypothetical protein